MDRHAWNQFVLEHGPRSGRFLQSWEWGEFQRAVGERVRRETCMEGGQIVGVAQWLDRRVPMFGEYAFCPKGPIGLGEPIGRGGEMFLRIEPEDEKFVAGARKSIDLDPAHSYLTDLTASEDALLNGMHPKTRYNLRAAQKHGVQVIFASHGFDTVWSMFEQTSFRGQFRLHPKRYYTSMLETLAQGDCRAFLATASHEGNFLAANIMIDYGDTRVYLHGASSNERRNLMGSYLLHWELLRDAKERGFSFYDWWGVAPVDASENHPWSGISRFKRGFPGVEYACPGTYDVVLKPFRYHLYQVARRIRRTV